MESLGEICCFQERKKKVVPFPLISSSLCILYLLIVRPSLCIFPPPVPQITPKHSEHIAFDNFNTRCTFALRYTQAKDYSLVFLTLLSLSKIFWVFCFFLFPPSFQTLKRRGGDVVPFLPRKHIITLKGYMQASKQ